MMRDELTQRLAKKLQVFAENKLRLAITTYMGHSEWLLEDIRDRLRVDTYAGGSQVWSLDNVPLIEMWPPTFHTDFAGASCTTRAEIPYRFLEPIGGQFGATKKTGYAKHA